MIVIMLLLLLSRFSHVWFCATSEMAAHQAPPSVGFSSKNTGVGCHFLLQCIKVKSESEVAQSCPTLRDPMDFSLPGSSVHGIFRKSTGVGCGRLLQIVIIDNIKTIAIVVAHMFVWRELKMPSNYLQSTFHSTTC